MNDQNFLRYLAEVNSTQSLGRFSVKNKLTKKVENLFFIVLLGSFLVSAAWEILLKVRL